MARDKHWANAGGHPSERELLLYMNGELDARATSRVQAHLQGCWACALERDRLTNAVSAFMQGRQAVFAGTEFPEAADRRFEKRLRRLAAESKNRPSRWWRTACWMRPAIPAGLAASAAVAVLMLFVWIRLSSVPSVSAREALSRAQLAEAQSLGTVTMPVVHQRLRLTRLANGRKPESVHWEIWHDARNNRFSQKVHEPARDGSSLVQQARKVGEAASAVSQHPLVAELGEILTSNHLDLRQPLSAGAFAAWRSSLRNAADSLSETRAGSGEEALKIVTSATRPFAANAIVKAELVLRKQDWHAVEQRLQVLRADGLRDYEMSETSYEVVALHSLSPSIFGVPVSPASLPRLASTSTSRPPMTESQILDLEVAVLHRLHRLNSCLGEEVEVVRGSFGLPEVRGLVESPERRAQITSALAQHPQVRVAIQTFAEMEGSALSLRGAGTDFEEDKLLATALRSSRNPAFRSPLQDHLARYFGQASGTGAPAKDAGETRVAASPRVVEFSNEVIALSQAAHAEAWALRHLAERYDGARLRDLPPRALALLQTIVQDHVMSLGKMVERCDALLTPVLGSLAGNNAEVTESASSAPTLSPSTWPSPLMQIFESVAETERLVVALFEGNYTETSLPQKANALLTAIARVKRDTKVRWEPSGVASLELPPQSEARSP